MAPYMTKIAWLGSVSFSRFVRPLLEKKAGIQALEWIPRVPAEEHAAYEARARADGFEDFQFVELASEGGLVQVAPREFTELSLLGEELEHAAPAKDRSRVEARLDAVEAELGRLLAS